QGLAGEVVSPIASVVQSVHATHLHVTAEFEAVPPAYPRYGVGEDEVIRGVAVVIRGPDSFLEVPVHSGAAVIHKADAREVGAIRTGNPHLARVKLRWRRVRGHVLVVSDGHGVEQGRADRVKVLQTSRPIPLRLIIAVA